MNTDMSQKPGSLVCLASACMFLLSTASYNLHAAPLSFELLPEDTWVSGVSGDGTTVVGANLVFVEEWGDFDTDTPFRWRNGTLEDLPLPDAAGGQGWATCCSHDGGIVMGGGWQQPMLWDAAGTLTVLPLPAGADWGWINGVSADGTLAVGDAGSQGGANQVVLWRNGVPEALFQGSTGLYQPMSADGRSFVGSTDAGTFRWTEGGGMTMLIRDGEYGSPNGSAISPEGSTVFGLAWGESQTTAFLHTTGGGILPLGPIPEGVQVDVPGPRGVAAFGSSAVGAAFPDNGPGFAFIWDPVQGLRDLNEVLATRGIDLQGHQMEDAMGISADGDTIAGNISEYDPDLDIYRSRGFVIRGARSLLAGDPNLKVTGLSGSPAAGFQMRWATAPDRLYRAHWSDDLAKWYPILPEVAATGAEESMNLAAGLSGRRFWRVQRVCDISFMPGFAEIAAGTYQMGDSFSEGNSAEQPVHGVQLASFRIAPTEVSKNLWDTVRAWGLENDYTDLPEGEGKDSNHPVQGISWYAAVKWCNARSEMQGMTPCYYTTTSRTVPYRTGTVALTEAYVDWSANGYRLPTEAEWEKAARGGLANKRFPWDDTISHALANYTSSGSPTYDLASPTGAHPDYDDGTPPSTAPITDFAAHGFGLGNMAGNVREWCWDRYGSTYYTSSPATDPRGPATGTTRVIRGGAWNDPAASLRCASRGFLSPSSTANNLGFRVVRSRQ